ncbi:hypothetical protein ES703_12149 [subsurface metagenome]
MKRRDFLRTIGFATAAAFTPHLQAARRRRPNILLIMTDQQFADALSCTMGHEHIETPNIDSLAASGMLFTKAYCANPLCVPNRSSIFTGRYPHEHGKQINSTSAIDAKEFPNIGMVLRKAGYTTGYFGKWHLPYPFKKSNAEDSGYDQRYDSRDYEIAAPTIEFIKKNKSKPFFVVFSLMNPHNICHPLLRQTLKKRRTSRMRLRRSGKRGLEQNIRIQIKECLLPWNYGAQMIGESIAGLIIAWSSWLTKKLARFYQRFVKQGWKRTRWSSSLPITVTGLVLIDGRRRICSMMNVRGYLSSSVGEVLRKSAQVIILLIMV